jgi:caffeoyl-CoA O-methyltransferase
VLTDQVLRVLGEIEALDREQKATGRDIPFWRISAEAGRLLYILVRARRARRAVEVGTSSGYSGIYIAAALAETGGHLWTLEREPFKIRLAHEHFRRAGLDPWVTQVEGDALQTLPQVVAERPEPVDFAFLDAVKADYHRYLELLRPRLVPGSVVCADNLGPANARAVAPYLDAVSRPPFVTTLVPTVNAEGEADALGVSFVDG